jgi:hypothetical protein
MFFRDGSLLPLLAVFKDPFFLASQFLFFFGDALVRRYHKLNLKLVATYFTSPLTGRSEVHHQNFGHSPSYQVWDNIYGHAQPLHRLHIGWLQGSSLVGHS